VAEQYRQAFRDWGLDPEELPSEEVSKRIRTSAIGPALTDALDDWARVSRKGAAERLRAVASLTDSDPWRRQVRKALADKDREAIQRLAEDAGAAQQTPSGIILLADALHNVGMDEQRLAVLREGQRRHPGDFWLAHEVAQACSAVEPPQLEEATRFYVASLTLRPQSAAVHVSLGNTMLARQRFAEAIASFREAIRLKPDDADAHYGLAVALHKQGKLNEAIAEYRETLRLDPKRKEALENLDRLLKSEKPR
jgi:tetratricopeptide (TPR) repeat protein